MRAGHAIHDGYRRVNAQVPADRSAQALAIARQVLAVVRASRRRPVTARRSFAAGVRNPSPEQAFVPDFCMR